MARKGVHINVYRLPSGEWRCDLKFNRNRSGEGMMISGSSERDEGPAMMGWSFRGALKGLSEPLKAIAKARSVATSILRNPAIAATFPQYALPALAVLKAIERAEKSGQLKKLRGAKDPALKKLATEIDELSNGKRTALSGGGMCLCDGSTRRNGRAGMSGSGMFPGRGRPSPFGLSSKLGPFGLPQGNPHPFAAWVQQQIGKGQVVDPLARQKLAAMWQHQRNMARATSA